MKPELSQLNAYEIREEKRLDDIHSDGILLVHKKSGARICVMSNEDVNKVFYIAFRTPPKDSTGVPHIIEHTVLCGSKKFPVKDPFIELVKGFYEEGVAVLPTAAGTGPMHMIYEALGVPMVAFGIGNANSRDHGGNENVSLADYYTHIELIKELIANYE